MRQGLHSAPPRSPPKAGRAALPVTERGRAGPRRRVSDGARTRSRPQQPRGAGPRIPGNTGINEAERRGRERDVTESVPVGAKLRSTLHALSDASLERMFRDVDTRLGELQARAEAAEAQLAAIRARLQD